MEPRVRTLWMSGNCQRQALPQVLSCPILDTLGYRVIFHTSDGRLVARASNVYCADEIRLARADTQLRITLSPLRRGDPPHRWYDVLDRVLKRS